jgi:hypothetical protein
MPRFVIQAAAINGVQFPGTRGYSHDRAEQLESEGHDGSPYEQGHLITRFSPTIDLNLVDLSEVFKASGAGGKFINARDNAFPLCSLDATNGIELWGAKMDTLGPGHAAGSVHTKRQYLRGLAWLAGLSWSGGLAEATIRAIPLSADGLTSPYTEATAALPTRPSTALGWVLDSATVAGQALNGIRSVSIEIDPKISHDFQAGRPHATDVLVAGPNGPLSITASVECLDISTPVGAGACSFVFKQIGHGGVYLGAVLTITFNGSFAFEGNWSGQHGQPSTKALTIRTRHDGTNLPMTWALS